MPHLRQNKVLTVSCYKAKKHRKKPKFKQLRYTTDFDTLGRPVKHITYDHERWWWYPRLKAKLGLHEKPLITHSFEFAYHDEGILDTVTKITRTPYGGPNSTETTQIHFVYNKANQLIYQKQTRTHAWSRSRRDDHRFSYSMKIEYYLNIDSVGVLDSILVIDTTGFNVIWDFNTKPQWLPIDRDYTTYFYSNYSKESDSVDTYNEKGQLIEINLHNYFAQLAESEEWDMTRLSTYFTTLTYNTEGLLILEENLDKERNVIHSKSWKYLNDSLLTEERRNDKLERFYIYTYY